MNKRNFITGFFVLAFFIGFYIYSLQLHSQAALWPKIICVVGMALSAAKVKVNALSARSQPDGYAVVNIVLEVKDRKELDSVINRLNQIQGVYHVARASGK